MEFAPFEYQARKELIPQVLKYFRHIYYTLPLFFVLLPLVGK